MLKSREEMNAAWARAVMSCGLPLNIVNNPHFREAVTWTAMCGSEGLTHETPGNYTTTLPRRTTFSKKTVPEAEAALNNGIEQKMRHLIEETGPSILSDGWKSTSNRPIVNVLASTQGLTQLKKAVDISGHEKSMQFIFETVDEVIKDIGPKHVFAACMDGACKGAFALIKAKYLQIQCFVCPSHGLDGFLKNVCSDNKTIRMQANEVGGIGMQMMEWDVSFFHDTFNNAWQVIKRVVRHEKAIAIFRKIAKEVKPEGGTEPKKFGETRYGSRVAMAERMLDTRAIYERLFIDTDLRAWIDKQDAKKRGKFEKARQLVMSDVFWKDLDTAYRTLQPAYQALR